LSISLNGDLELISAGANAGISCSESWGARAEASASVAATETTIELNLLGLGIELGINADLLSAMLPALDHIDHALASLEKTTAGTEATESNPYIEGFKLIQNELLRGLDKFGLSPIESIGKPFDVEVHEALSKMPSDSVAPEHVLFEVRKGYMLNGKVLRAAQVIVSAPVE
jgi:hypothetical protein